MKKVILYVATSLDGYIADRDHQVKWLEELENPDGNDYGYQAFMDTIDTVIMGRKTYEVIQGFDIDWPYANCQTLVLSRQQDLKLNSPNTALLSGDVFEEIRTLSGAWSEKNIWVVGGGLTVRSLLEHQCIDEIMLFTAPILLGEGIRLFPEFKHRAGLKLLESKSYPSGMIYSHYQVSKDTQTV